jgi:D-tyrosyl-tRNA(Tyr) deacylase
MRAVVQRVTSASVTIAGSVTAEIGAGYMVLLGVEVTDNEAGAYWLAGKIAQLRVMNDENGKMNLDIRQTGGEVLVVSQFTLHAAYKKGNRPSFIRAAKPDVAIPLYEYFCNQLSALLSKPVQTGVFGADMKVSLTNDGPVTIIMDTKNEHGTEGSE